MNDAPVSRRDFLAIGGTVGGGLLLGLCLPDAMAHKRMDEKRGAHVRLSAWISVDPDNTITAFVSRPEIGSGVLTSTAMLLAEDLDADWAALRIEYGQVAPNLPRMAFGDRSVLGSQSTLSDYDRLRRVGAQARAVLVRAASLRWNVPTLEILTRDSMLFHEPSGRRLTYGAVAAQAAVLAPPDADSIVLKPLTACRLLGKATPRRDSAKVLVGAEVYGIDVVLPGLKYAAIAISPVRDARIKSYDAAVAMRLPGVRAVVEIAAMPLPTWPASPVPLVAYHAAEPSAASISRTDAAIAVIADRWWQATSALSAMPILWEDGPNSNFSSDEWDSRHRAALRGAAGVEALRLGDAERALNEVVTRVDAEYYVPLIHQAALEPLSCTALVTEDRFELWVPTQDPDRALLTAAAALGMPWQVGEVHIVRSGGSFGRRLTLDYVNQAAQIAQHLKGTPVKLIWSREQDMRHGSYNPSALSRLSAGFDGSGNLVAWRQRVAGNIQSKSTGLLPVGRVYQGYMGGADLSPQVVGAGNVLLDSISIPAPVTLGTARSVDSYPGAFFLQGFIDELALAARQDPYDFQRSLLEPRRVPAHLPDRDVMVAKMLRWRNVLDAVVAQAEWKRTLGPGRGRGLSIFQHGETCTAAVCEVRLEADGILTVERVVFAADPGNVLNPLGAKAQIEGGIIFGLTSALYGRITVEKGRVVEGNFNAYRLMRMNEAPLIEVHLVPSGGFWGGLGEVGVPTMAPSLTNAIVNAGGPRIRNLPILSNNLARRA